MNKGKIIRSFLKLVYWTVILGIVFGVGYLCFMAYETYRVANL